MQLELTISSYQRLSPSVTCSHRVGPGKVSVIGRAPDCDWHLPDPNKILSSRHAEIFLDAGAFHVRDTSTNGVYLNQDTSPLGRGQTAGIGDGDRLRLGDFEIDVAVQYEDDAVELPSAAQYSAPSGAEEPLTAAFASEGGASGVADEPAWGLGGRGGNEMPDVLAAGLGERLMADAHVPMQEPSIPGEWQWDETPEQAAIPSDPMAAAAPQPQARNEQSALAALWDGLGLSPERASDLGVSFYQELGGLTRVLLDRLLDMLHARARQKQQLRVAQTLFQRSENNPLKFSATPQDALDSLLLRPHAANLGARDAVDSAFDDIMSHERAVLRGVEAVVADLLANGADNLAGKGLFAHRKALDTIRRQRDWQREAYGDTERMMRSDVFIEAYEKEVDLKEGSAES